MLTRCATVLLFLVALAGACVAEPFRDGDTVVFFGDSITHGGLYHKYIVDFYRTRFPERKIRFVNSRAASTSHCWTPCRKSRNPAPCLTQTNGTARRRGFCATTTAHGGLIPGART